MIKHFLTAIIYTCTKIVFGQGSVLDLAWGAFQTSV